MRIYEDPTIEILELDKSDLIACSFGNLSELDGAGTDTPIKAFGWNPFSN